MELNKDPIENPILDIKNYINIHLQNMPKVTGQKGYSLTGTLREQDDQEEYAPPEQGILPSQIYEDELMPHYFPPNFLRPLPVEEEEEKRESLIVDGEFDYLHDELDAIWLIPGMLPEPVWEYSMCCDMSTANLKTLINKAVKMSLKDEEYRAIIKPLKTDPELIFNIGMTPQRLPSLVINNPHVAFELLIIMTNTTQITKYYDALSGMKLSPNTLEVFNRLSNFVELPQEFIQIFLKNCMNQCRNSTETKVNKNRMVRLVCVFLQSIIKSRMINLQDVFIDVQAFCIEFSSIKEANGIYKMLQSEQAQRNLMNNAN